MTDTTQKVDTPDAREASMSRVQTQDSLLASLAAPASEAPAKEEKAETKQEGSGDQKPAKKGPQERIVALVTQRKEAEARADASEQRAMALEAELRAIRAQAQPMEQAAKPTRASYASEDEYIEALTDWKAQDAVAKREREQAEARLKAEQEEIAHQWDKRQKKAIDAIPDYADVVGSSEVVVPPYVHQALLESESGPEIAYYLALNPDEAKRIAAMKPLAAIRRIAALEKEVSDDGDVVEEKPKASELPKKSKAPEPINPVKGIGASNAGKAESFEDYKRRRLGK